MYVFQDIKAYIKEEESSETIKTEDWSKCMV